MTWKTLKLSEDDPHRPNSGFYRHYYATIDVGMTSDQSGWVWQQVDLAGNPVGASSKVFPTEDAALNDASISFDGTFDL